MLFIYYLLFGYFLYISNYLYNQNGLMHISRKILKLCNYKIDIDIEDDIEQLPSKVLIISSHTSIYDFIIGMLFYYGYLRKKYNTYVLMKKSFERMVKPFLHLVENKVKLISVNQNKKMGLTDQIYENLKDKDNYMLYIAPEGTRKCTDNIKSGYWILSKKLNIDIVYWGIDFNLKNISIEKNRKVKEDWEDEKYEFIKNCKKYIPLYPDRCYWTKDFYINLNQNQNQN